MGSMGCVPPSAGLESGMGSAHVCLSPPGERGSWVLRGGDGMVALGDSSCGGKGANYPGNYPLILRCWAPPRALPRRKLFKWDRVLSLPPPLLLLLPPRGSAPPPHPSSPGPQGPPHPGCPHPVLPALILGAVVAPCGGTPQQPQLGVLGPPKGAVGPRDLVLRSLKPSTPQGHWGLYVPLLVSLCPTWCVSPGRLPHAIPARLGGLGTVCPCPCCPCGHKAPSEPSNELGANEGGPIKIPTPPLGVTGRGQDGAGRGRGFCS